MSVKKNIQCNHKEGYWDENTSKYRCTSCGFIMQETPVLRVNLAQAMRECIKNPKPVKDEKGWEIEQFL